MSDGCAHSGGFKALLHVDRNSKYCCMPDVYCMYCIPLQSCQASSPLTPRAAFDADLASALLEAAAGGSLGSSRVDVTHARKSWTNI